MKAPMNIYRLSKKCKYIEWHEDVLKLALSMELIVLLSAFGLVYLENSTGILIKGYDWCVW